MEVIVLCFSIGCEVGFEEPWCLRILLDLHRPIYDMRLKDFPSGTCRSFEYDFEFWFFLQSIQKKFMT